MTGINENPHNRRPPPFELLIGAAAILGVGVTVYVPRFLPTCPKSLGCEAKARRAGQYRGGVRCGQVYRVGRIRKDDGSGRSSFRLSKTAEKDGCE